MAVASLGPKVISFRPCGCGCFRHTKDPSVFTHASHCVALEKEPLPSHVVLDLCRCQNCTCMCKIAILDGPHRIVRPCFHSVRPKSDFDRISSTPSPSGSLSVWTELDEGPLPFNLGALVSRPPPSLDLFSPSGDDRSIVRPSSPSFANANNDWFHASPPRNHSLPPLDDPLSLSQFLPAPSPFRSDPHRDDRFPFSPNPPQPQGADSGIRPLFPSLPRPRRPGKPKRMRRARRQSRQDSAPEHPRQDSGPGQPRDLESFLSRLTLSPSSSLPREVIDGPTGQDVEFWDEPPDGHDEQSRDT